MAKNRKFGVRQPLSRTGRWSKVLYCIVAQRRKNWRVRPNCGRRKGRGWPFSFGAIQGWSFSSSVPMHKQRGKR